VPYFYKQAVDMLTDGSNIIVRCLGFHFIILRHRSPY
jgi:hypothetical protein